MDGAARVQYSPGSSTRLQPTEPARHHPEHRGREGAVQNQRPNLRGGKAVFERVELGVEAFGHCVHLVAQRSNVDFDVCYVRAQTSDVGLESSDPRASTDYVPERNLRTPKSLNAQSKAEGRKVVVLPLRDPLTMRPLP